MTTRINVFGAVREDDAFVALQIGDAKPTFMRTREAKLLGMQMIGTADHAENELMLQRWIGKRLGLSSSQLEALMEDFRKTRAAEAANTDGTERGPAV